MAARPASPRRGVTHPSPQSPQRRTPYGGSSKATVKRSEPHIGHRETSCGPSCLAARLAEVLMLGGDCLMPRVALLGYRPSHPAAHLDRLVHVVVAEQSLPS